MNTSIEVYSYTISEFLETDEDGEMTQECYSWTIGLWFDEWEQSGVETIYLAWDDNDIVGFQTVNSDNQTIAIEIKESHKGQGISRLLIEESGSYLPERNENPTFWGWALKEYGE